LFFSVFVSPSVSLKRLHIVSQLVVQNTKVHHDSAVLQPKPLQENKGSTGTRQ
jgi:hypothetical protein